MPSSLPLACGGPRVGAPKNGQFPDLMDLMGLLDRVPGSSFESTETMVSSLLGSTMTPDFHIVLIPRDACT